MRTESNRPESDHWTAGSADVDQYNHEHFVPGMFLQDNQLGQRSEAPKPGSLAPEFALRDAAGNAWNLQELQGRPVVLLIGSGTCPVTQGNLPGLQELHAEYKDRCQWLMLYVREAHPGEKMPAHKSYEQKREQADFFQELTGIRWPVLVDEVDGQVHKQYGLQPNSAFLIDADGRVAFVGETPYAPMLRSALEGLFRQNMRGEVSVTMDKMPQMLGPILYGWEAVERGGEISKRDLAKYMPPLATNVWAGHDMQPMFNPEAAATTRLTTPSKLSWALGGAFAAGLLRWALRGGRRGMLKKR
jgi:cytochrome oxidase Cu insertion factor (SCO1/SenC/PrrC family)